MVTTKMKRFDLDDRLIEFSVSVCRVVEEMPSTMVGELLTSQLLRCATSPVANYGEAQGAESRRDFIHKLKLCLKELRETRAWLKFLAKLELAGAARLQPILAESDQLISIFVSSIGSARKNQDIGRR